MSMLGRPKGKVAGTAKPAERGGRDTAGNTDRNVDGPQGDTPAPPPELPLDDDGNDARNIGG
jgi:hypothetical protein